MAVSAARAVHSHHCRPMWGGLVSFNVRRCSVFSIAWSELGATKRTVPSAQHFLYYPQFPFCRSHHASRPRSETEGSSTVVFHGTNLFLPRHTMLHLQRSEKRLAVKICTSIVQALLTNLFVKTLGSHFLRRFKLQSILEGGRAGTFVCAEGERKSE